MGRPPEGIERIRTLGGALETARLVAFDITMEHEWKPTSSSPLSAELDDKMPAPNGAAWGLGIPHARQMAQMWFEMGSQAVYCSGILLSHDPTLQVAPWPTVRAAVEHFATLAWLLAAETNGVTTDAKGRLARAALIELEDQRQLKNELNALHAPGKPNYTEDPSANQAFDDYRDGLSAIFPSFDRSTRAVEGMVLPSLSDRVGEFAGRALGGGNGWHAYNLLSGNTHPTRSAFLDLLQPSGGGHRVEAPADHFEGVARLALVSQFAAVEEIFRWFGWPRSSSTLGRLEKVVSDVYPDAVVTAPGA